MPAPAAVRTPFAAPRRVPGSRFTVPSLRPRLLERERLSRAMLDAIAEARLVLVVAGAGFGKTTALAQALAEAPADWALSWIAVDRLDRAPARLFRVLVDSINATLHHADALDADTLTRMVGSSEAGARAAAAEVAGWLAECEVGRFVWVWDDLHVIDDAVTWNWLDHFIGLLPERVTCVMASREPPRLPLARRRAAGHLAEFPQSRLRFSTDEAAAFLARLGEASSEQLAQAWIRRSQGWIAGLRLLAAGCRDDAAALPGPAGSLVPGDEQVFEYLAEEVLAKLPPELSAFVSVCCVLDELDPQRCTQLSGRVDSLAMIDQLIQRNLFVTVLDPSRPTVRLHDLFRDFLNARLRREAPQAWRELNLRAASIADEPLRAVRHAAEAGEPRQALEVLGRHAEALLRQGHTEAVTQALRTLAAAGVGDDVQAHWIAGLLAWQRSAFDEGRASLELAWQGFQAAGDRAHAVRSLLLLARVVSYTGDVRAAAERLERIDDTGLEADLQAELALERAWLFNATGRPDEASAALRTAIELAERVASVDLCIRLAERIRSHFVATPAFSELFRRFHALVIALDARPDSLAFAHATVLAAWAAMWEGDLERAHDLVESVWVDVERWREFRALMVDLCMVRTMLLSIAGRGDEAVELVQEVIRTGQTMTMGTRNAWVGTYLYLMARLHWSSGDDASLRQDYARLLTAFRETEWPYMAGARRWAEALVAYQDGQWARAAELMSDVVDAQRRYPLLTIGGDVRVAAVDALARSGQVGRAQAMAGELLDDALEAGMFGRLLLERAELVVALADRIDREHPRRAAWLALIGRCNALRPAVCPVGPALAPQPGPATLDELTTREREVVALIVKGASNKRIALTLDISLHTVKRHVANIIAKLGVHTRGEVIARYLGSGR